MDIKKYLCLCCKVNVSQGTCLGNQSEAPSQMTMLMIMIMLVLMTMLTLMIKTMTMSKAISKIMSMTMSMSIREHASQMVMSKAISKAMPRTMLINVNDNLQNKDKNINVIATSPENFRCLISGPSEFGNTFLLKYLFLYNIQFDRLYIIGPTGDQYNGLKYKDIVFIKNINELPPPDKLPKELKKLMMFDDVNPKEPVIKEYFCRGRHNNCNMIYLNQNLFSLDRQSVRENCNLFVLFEQRGNVINRL